MQAELISGLRSRAPAIRRRWERLLMTPLVEPAIDRSLLVGEIPQSLERLLAELARPWVAGISLSAAKAIPRPRFACGRNPYLPFFDAGERALLETLVIVHCSLTVNGHRDLELAEFYTGVRKVALQQAKTYCERCPQRGIARGCRFGPPLEADVSEGVLV